MSKVNDNFFERKNPWSKVKDELLGCYIEPYFQILINGRERTNLVYVDCFAGAGKFKDGSEGSPLIGIKKRDRVLESARIKANKEINCVFIEPKYYGELNENIKSISPFLNNIKIIEGKFEDNINNVLINSIGKDVFLYIDPFGISQLDFKLLTSFLYGNFKTFEMLINFNSFGFFRNACKCLEIETKDEEAFKSLNELNEEVTSGDSDSLVNKLNNIAGGEYWIEIVKTYLKERKFDSQAGYRAEKEISKQYCKHLSQNGKFYVLNMPIKYGNYHHPKYRMIHVSAHPKGCTLMANNMLKRKESLALEIEQTGQGDLFSEFFDLQRNVEDDLISKEQTGRYVNDFMNKIKGEISLTKFQALFLCNYGVICKTGTINSILKKMESENKIELIRSHPETKTGKRRGYMDESNGKTVTIRRKE